MSLPTESIDEVLNLASSNLHDHGDDNELPSPRGVADINAFASSDGGDGTPPAPAGKGKRKKVAGSAVECLEYATPRASTTTAPSTNTAHSSAAAPSSALAHFPNKQAAHRAISQCATRFINDVWGKSIIITEYSYRMTVRPSDVAKALELFMEVDANALWYRSFPAGKVLAEDNENEEGVNEEKLEEDGEMDENWKDTNDGDDVSDEKLEDEDSDEEMEMDNMNDNLTNNTTETPTFDTAYPPINNIHQLSDEQFKEHLLLPILREWKHDGVPRARGVDGMLKHALYALLVAKLS